jgi:hypothetical protein
MESTLESLTFKLIDGNITVGQQVIERWQREFPAINVRHALLKSQARMAIKPTFTRESIGPALVEWLIREDAYQRSKAVR